MSKAMAEYHAGAARRTLKGVLEERSPASRALLQAQLNLDLIRAIEALTEGE